MKNTILSLLVAVGLIASASAATLTDNLAVYYDFNGNGNDSSGNNNNGDFVGSSLGTDRFGNLSSALEVTANTYFVSQNNLGVTGNSDRTISLWVKATSDAAWLQGYILGWGINPVNDITMVYSTYWLSNPAITPDQYNNISVGGQTEGMDQGVQVLTTPSYLTGNWHSVTWTYSGALANSFFYLDGRLQTNNFSTSGSGILNTSDSPLNVNGFLVGQNRGIDGLIDDVGVWNRSLSSTEVANLYAAQVIPEPSTYALFGLGTIGMLMVIRRKKTAYAYTPMKKIILSLFVAVGLIGSASAATLTGDLTNGLVAYYDFNGNVNDSIGGYNGTIVGDLIATNNRFGNSSSAYYFNNSPGNWGPQSYVQLANSLPITGDLTINMWFSLGETEANKWYALIAKRGNDSIDTAAWEYYLQTYPPAGLVAWGGEDPNNVYNNTYNQNQWYMATFTKSGNNFSNYINGSLVGSFTGSDINNDASVTIGAFYPGVAYSSFVGSIDDVGIWNTSLNSSQITQLYVVPEPSTYALFGIGSIGLLMVMRRKKTA